MEKNIEFLPYNTSSLWYKRAPRSSSGSSSNIAVYARWLLRTSERSNERPFSRTEITPLKATVSRSFRYSNTATGLGVGFLGGCSPIEGARSRRAEYALAVSFSFSAASFSFVSLKRSNYFVGNVSCEWFFTDFQGTFSEKKMFLKEILNEKM